MPVLTYYLKTAKYRIPIYTIEAYPISWPEQVEQLREVGTIIHVNRDGQTTSEIILDLHLPGRTIMAGRTAPSITRRMQLQRYVQRGTYTGQRIRPRRMHEFRCILIFNPYLNTVQVKSPSFGPHLQEIRAEYRAIERGLEYTAPPLIPRMDLNTAGNPLALIRSRPSAGQPHANYERTVQVPYRGADDENSEKGPYARQLVMPYAERGKRIFEEDKEWKEEE